MKTYPTAVKDFAGVFSEVKRRTSPELTIDLTNVTKIDSAGFVLVLDLVKDLFQGTKLVIAHSDKIKSFAQIYDLDEILHKYATFN